MSTATRSHGIYAVDKVTIGRGEVEWTVSFATEDAVYVTREVPANTRTGVRTLKRYLYGADQIATLKVVSR